MKYYLAPMEGITGFIYRNAYKKSFDNIDKYFAPFIVPNKSTSTKTKEFRDILPENNVGIELVPQILTNNSEGFIDAVKKMQNLGYKEVNLNLGCPSGTVVSKGRGSGFLGRREELDRFLEEIYKIENIKISIKTRLGVEIPEEFYEIIKIYNKYPLEELIIHPRTRQDFYGNTPNLEVYKDAIELSKANLVYNGDIFTKNDLVNLQRRFPDMDKVMVGRGVLANPGLIGEIEYDEYVTKERVHLFHDEVFNGYRELFMSDNNAMHRMKEVWGYMSHIFTDNKKYIKKIKKAKCVDAYEEAVDSLFAEQEIIKGAGLFSQER